MINMINNVVYDLKAIKKYGLSKHLKYVFDVNHVIVNLHINLDHIPVFQHRNSLVIKEVDKNDHSILRQWADLVNDAFGSEFAYDIPSSNKKINDHLYLKVTNLFFMYKKDELIGSYFIGVFKKNEYVGGGGRLVISKKFQNLGFGRHLFLYGLHKLREKGLLHAEIIYWSKRINSIEMGIACGGVPEFRKKYLQLQSTRKNYIIRLWARYNVSKVYAKYLKQHKCQYGNICNIT